MSTAPFKAPVIECVYSVLSTAGFKRRGNTFWKDVGDVVHLVSLQSSRSSSASEVQLTMNLAVSVPSLGGSKTDIWSAQWRERIGHLMPDPSDRWWSISTSTEAKTAAREMAEALEKYGLPSLRQISSAADLQRKWESGQSPGLTERQAAEYIDQLRRNAV